MTVNAFGGQWTADKLEVLRKYLHFYSTALAGHFKLVYIDTFAGSGSCRITLPDGSEQIIDGSAKIALDCAGFERYHFIERKQAHVQELRALAEQHPRGSLANIAKGSASDLLWPLLLGLSWSGRRGVLFLDPFGLQVDWPMVERIAATRALDVFFLVSLSGLYRNAAVNRAHLRPGHQSALTRFLGTDDWMRAVYVRQQDDLFGPPQVTRDRGHEGMLQFTTDRLRKAFPYVADPCLLGSANGAPLFALYFAVANGRPQALGLARRVGEDILRPLRL